MERTLSEAGLKKYLKVGNFTRTGDRDSAGTVPDARGTALPRDAG